jgi:Predicted Zn-dependent proteases and their inactivated homologs
LALDESLLLKAIDRGLDLGAKYVEARMQDDYGYSVTVRNDKLIGASQGRSRGVGIRVVVDGSLGFASTDNLTLEGVIKAVEKAVVSAKALSRIKRKPVEFSDERVGKARYSVLEKKPLMDLELEEAVQILKDTYRSSSGALKQAKMPSMFSSLRVSIQEKKIVTSEGGIVESRVPRLYVSIGSTLLYQGKSLQRIREFGGSGGRELIDEWSIIKVVVDEVLNLEKTLVEGKTPPRRKSTSY